MNLDQLPDLCLIVILDHLPLRDLIKHIGLVSHRFHTLQSAVFLKRTSLRLLNFTECRYSGIYVENDELDFHSIDNFDLLTKYDCSSSATQSSEHLKNSSSVWHDVTLTEGNSALLSDTFPNVKQFTIVDNYNKPDMSLQMGLCNLIGHWADSLTHLTVIGQFNARLVSGTIEKCHKLTHLSTNLSIFQVNQLDHSILGQLQQFNCRYSSLYSPGSDLAFTLNQLITDHSENITRFGLDLVEYDSSWERWNLPLVSAKLTRLRAHVQTLPELQWFTAHCRSLTYLDLSFGTWYTGELGCLLACLATLPQLYELKLNILFNSFHLQPDNLFNEPELPALEAVSKVELRFPFDPHHLRLVEAVFPAARQISFRFSAREFVSLYSHLICRRSSCENCVTLQGMTVSDTIGGFDHICFDVRNGRICRQRIVVPR